MSGDSRIRVMLAGPYPHGGGMTGTYGRILENLQTSPVFRERVLFIPHHVTLPQDGNAAKRWGLDLIRALSSLRSKPDILHFIVQKYRALYREYPIFKLARRMGTRTIVDVRAGTLQAMLNRPGYRLQNAMMRGLVRGEDALVLECKKDLVFVQEQFGREGLYLPNVVRQTDFHRIAPARLPLNPGQPVRLIYSGRYSAEKGVPVMLQALALLSGRGLQVELHLTGQAADPAIAELIRAHVDSPQPGIRVIDHGWNVPDLYVLLASAHIFVMPTRWHGEGHPNSVTEAMMAGLGMILSDWQHRADIVPERGAIVIPPEEPAALADAVTRYIDSPDLLAEAGRTNRRYVEENYLDYVCYPRLLTLYEKLASRERCRG